MNKLLFEFGQCTILAAMVSFATVVYSQDTVWGIAAFVAAALIFGTLILRKPSKPYTFGGAIDAFALIGLWYAKASMDESVMMCMAIALIYDLAVWIIASVTEFVRSLRGAARRAD